MRFHPSMRHLLCCTLSLFTLAPVAHLANAQAQTPVTAGTVVATTPQAVDPLLVKPASQLTPEQIASLQKRFADYAGLDRYRDENATLPPAEPGRVVFFGDSIIDAWSHRDNPIFFPGKPYLNRGIGGETTAQMVIRFQQDVVALKPAAVVILAAINDIAGNTGPMTLQMTEDNFRSMVEIAQANRIRVILSSTLPANVLSWRPGVVPTQKIRDLNAWLQQYAAAHHCTYLDFYSALVDEQGGMKPGLSKDGVHPTPAGYAVMAPLAQAAVDKTLR